MIVFSIIIKPVANSMKYSIENLLPYKFYIVIKEYCATFPVVDYLCIKKRFLKVNVFIYL